MNFKSYLKKSISHPPHILAKKAATKIKKEISIYRREKADKNSPTYSNSSPIKNKNLQTLLTPFPIENLIPLAPQIKETTDHYLEHRFDLLGSGWVIVKHDRECKGLEGHFYPMGKEFRLENKEAWVDRNINKSNRAESIKIWSQLSPSYIPIDWQLDFKSGYRWKENTWYKKILYGHLLGVDVKVPWELSRMQHLPQLAFAFALSKNKIKDFRNPQVYLQEFQNEILDFIATNPPRYGVNWSCTMDVAIRISNWLITYDLFKTFSAEFDTEFEKIFIRSVYEHGEHIVNNLEWGPDLRGNHYLADIVGLLFVSTYLPRSSIIDAWLSLAVQELINEVSSQFYEEGTNFEASTSYHRLSAEMVVYATALVLGLSEDKQEVLKNYDHRIIKGNPCLKPAPLPFYKIPGSDKFSPLPDWYFKRLEKMAEFTMHIAKPSGHIPQIGDNDNGRFLKIQPIFKTMPTHEVKNLYLNLSDYHELTIDALYWNEEHLDHRHLVAAINGLFGRDDFYDFTGKNRLETFLIHQISGGVFLPSSQNPIRSSRDSHDEKIKSYAYPKFGLYVYRSKRFYLVVRCGSIGQNGNGGHGHNDQLSFELTVDGTDFLVDPGTYLYTPFPCLRNKFRSTAMHNTLSFDNKEQNTWLEGTKGLFQMNNNSNAETVQFDQKTFIGKHSGFGTSHQRTFLFEEQSVKVIEEYESNCMKSIDFLTATRVGAFISGDHNSVTLEKNGVKIELQGTPGKWSIHEGRYSPGYGLIQKCKIVRFEFLSQRTSWQFKF